MPIFDQMWGSAERSDFVDAFEKRLETAPLSLANLFRYEQINGGMQVMTSYDLPKYGHIVSDIGAPVDSEKISFYRSVIRTSVIEYGPIELNDYTLADAGNRLDIGRLGTDMGNGAIRTQDQLALACLENDIELQNGDRIPLSPAVKIPFDTTSGSNIPWPNYSPDSAHKNPDDKTQPTWAELNNNACTLGLTPQKLHLAAAIMNSNGIPPEANKICLCSNNQMLNFINHPDVKSSLFNITPALATTIGQLQPYAEIRGFIQSDVLPIGLPMGPNEPYFQSDCLAGWRPINSPAAGFIERAYLIAPDFIKAAVTVPWRMKEGTDIKRRIDLMLIMGGKYGFSRIQDAAVVVIECFTNIPRIIPFNIIH